jgi:hypothetical protein
VRSILHFVLSLSLLIFQLLATGEDDRRGEIIVLAREHHVKPSHALDVAVMEAIDRGIMIHSVVIPSPPKTPSSPSNSALRPGLMDVPNYNRKNKHNRQQVHQDENFVAVGGSAGTSSSSSSSPTGIVRRASVETGGKSVVLDDLDGHTPVHSMAEMLEALEKIIPPANAVKVSFFLSLLICFHSATIVFLCNIRK